MQSRIISFLFLLGFLLPASAAFSQKLVSDTTLNYRRFRTESLDLSSKEKSEEIWVVTFWASFNGRSMNAVEDITKTAAKYKNKPVRFVYISGDRNRKAWLTAMSDRKMTGEHFVVSDTAEYRDLRNRFQHNSLPAIFIFNRDKKVVRQKNVDELTATLTEEAKTLPNHAYGWTPPPPVVVAPPPPTEEELLRGWVYHVVKKGETLYSLSKRYNISVTGLQTVNGMTSTSIFIGQKVKIRPDTNAGQANK
ncbi:MAG: LysM peptidoglycan-binding domain-containing protein [Bacteroidia bacterium]|nr:LysM peptidoglycan-binding domain-containing protein [Bacteroidia bacterium]